jgi:hypothetical protein
MKAGQQKNESEQGDEGRADPLSSEGLLHALFSGLTGVCGQLRQIHNHRSTPLPPCSEPLRVADFMKPGVQGEPGDGRLLAT